MTTLIPRDGGDVSRQVFRVPSLSLRIAVIGDACTDKNEIVYALANGLISREGGAYIPKVMESQPLQLDVDGKICNVTLTDTSGLEEQERQRSVTYATTDVFIVCYRVDDGKSLTNVKLKWLPDVAKHSGDTQPIMVLLGTHLEAIPSEAKGNNTDAIHHSVTNALSATDKLLAMSRDADAIACAIRAILHIQVSCYAPCTTTTKTSPLHLLLEVISRCMLYKQLIGPKVFVRDELTVDPYDKAVPLPPPSSPSVPDCAVNGGVMTVSGAGLTSLLTFENDKMTKRVQQCDVVLTSETSLPLMSPLSSASSSASPRLINLRVMNFYAGAMLYKVPDCMGSLTNLRVLNIGGPSMLSTLPPSIGNLVQLLRLTTLPDQLSGCVSLQSLCVIGSLVMTQLPLAIGKLTNLSDLNFSGCTKLVDVPSECIRPLRNLQSLSLAGCSALPKLPKEIGQLYQLKTLDLRLLDLPDEILQCQRLQVMYTQYVYMMSMSYYNSRSGFTAQGRPLHLSKILNLRVVGYFRSGRFLLLPYDMLGQPLGKGITRVMDVLFALLALASVCVPAYLYRSAESSYSSWITMALLLTTIIIPFLYVLGSVIINDEIGINSSTWMSGHNRVKWRNRAGDVNRANAVAVITIILEYFQISSFAFPAFVPWPVATRAMFSWSVFNVSVPLYYVTFFGAVLVAWLVRYSVEIREVSVALPLMLFALNTLFLPIMQQCMAVFGCSYFDVNGPDLYVSNDSDPIQCWIDPVHLVMVMVGLVTVGLYFPLASFATSISQECNRALDIRFQPKFQLIATLFKFAFAIPASLIGGSSVYTYLAVMGVLQMGLAVITWMQGSTFSCIFWAGRFRQGLISCSAFGTVIAAYQMLLDDENDYTPSIIYVVLCMFIMLGCLISVNSYYKKHPVVDSESKGDHDDVPNDGVVSSMLELMF